MRENKNISFSPQSTSPRCGTPISSGFPDTARSAMVEAHNVLRSRVATGAETRGSPGPQPPAADMKELVWDDELAAVAQRWAEQCR